MTVAEFYVFLFGALVGLSLLLYGLGLRVSFTRSSPLLSDSEVETLVELREAGSLPCRTPQGQDLDLIRLESMGYVHRARVAAAPLKESGNVWESVYLLTPLGASAVSFHEELNEQLNKET